VEPKLFTYVRYNVELSPDGLESIGVRDVRVKDVGPLDAFRHIDALRRVGQAAARKVRKEHFAKFLNVGISLPTSTGSIGRAQMGSVFLAGRHAL
jgi:uncharacterized protein